MHDEIFNCSPKIDNSSADANVYDECRLRVERDLSGLHLKKKTAGRMVAAEALTVCSVKAKQDR